jgi:hypothetical protein
MNIHMNEFHGVGICDIKIFPFNMEVEVQIFTFATNVP